MKLCITGGGTGGHLMIAESLVDECVKEGHEAIFIGSLKGQDRNYFESNSKFSHVYFLDTTGVVNQRGFAKVKALYRVFLAFLKSRTILKKHRIDATYSVGGFSAAPASFASLSRFIPLFIHEQNAKEGRLNSLLKPYAKGFVSAYDSASKIKGYPVKEVFFRDSRVRDELKTIIFLGGSHGAVAINDLALSVAHKLNKMGIKIIHQAGEKDYERVRDEYKKMGLDAELVSFSKELPSLISRADFAVSRSGASTLWELSASGCPALFVPYPHAASDHQYFNALFIVENDLGWCEREGEKLRSQLLHILKEPLEQKSQALLKYSHKNVAKEMIDEVVRMVK
jgi:UDP-N-acetylglucosamine--N-acetylmuramyl-(pentapeptide) pyrophosphoryl-undecaprenol N-acetylglucosamine transferase